MTAVVDSSVIVAALTDSGRDGEWAESIIAGGSLFCPELVLAEAANVLRRLEIEASCRGSRRTSRWETSCAST